MNKEKPKQHQTRQTQNVHSGMSYGQQHETG